MASFRPHNNAEVIPKIQNTLESIVDGLLREEEVAIPLKLKNPPGKQPSPLATEISNHWTSVSFPARTFREAWRFST